MPATIKWKPWMSLLGKEPVVRLERLEERRVKSNSQVQPDSYDLVSDNRLLDQMVSVLTRELGLIDTVYGSSVYMPAEPHAKYKITASISGMVARPTNQVAEKAVMEWSGQ